MSWTKLLVPNDFSPCADVAVATARRLGANAELLLFHASALPDGLAPDTLVHPRGGEPVRVGAHAIRAARERLEQAAAPLRKAGLKVTTVATVGRVVDEILHAAEEHGADGIVMGTRGRKGLAQLLFGGTVDEVVRRASVPVMTVRLPCGAAAATDEELAAEDELAG